MKSYEHKYYPQDNCIFFHLLLNQVSHSELFTFNIVTHSILDKTVLVAALLLGHRHVLNSLDRLLRSWSLMNQSFRSLRERERADRVVACLHF